MFYNPVQVLTDPNLYGSRFLYFDACGGAQQNAPDNKSIMSIVGRKKLYIKTSSKYESVPCENNESKLVFYNIYDLRDYIIKDSYSIKDFMQELLESKRIILLSGNSKFKFRNPNRTVFSTNSHPILITFTFKDNVKIVVENPNVKVDSYNIPDDVAYVYKQKDTFVMSVKGDKAIILDIYDINLESQNKKNEIIFSKLDKKRINKPLDSNVAFTPLPIALLSQSISEKIKPSKLDLDSVFTKINTVINSKTSKK